MITSDLKLKHFAANRCGMKNLAYICALVAFTAFPALAAESDWVDIGPDARLRIVTAGAAENGVLHAALEVDMPDNMKTYWRIPGETGIPVEVDLSKSNGVSGHEILWPYPTREQKDGFIDFVYYGHTLFPINLMLDDENTALDAIVMMGICTDICMPVRAEVQLPLSTGDDDAANVLRIRQAMADVPLEGAEAGQIEDLTFSPAAKTMSVRIDDRAVDPRSIIVDTGDPGALFSMPEFNQQGSVGFELIGRVDPQTLVGQEATITFLTVDGPYEVTRTIRAADGTSAN